MIAIPAAVRTLIKSQIMTGTDRPCQRVTIGGDTSGTLLANPTDWTTWRTFVGDSPARTYGNMVETTDGRAAISYIESDDAYVAFATSVAGVLAGTASFGAGTLIKADVLYGQTSLSVVGGKLRLAISWWDYGYTEYLTCEYWADSDGNGADFAYVSMISPDLNSEYSGFDGPGIGKTLGPITELTTNVWVVMCPENYYIYHRQRCCYTTDGGATWNQGASTTASLFNVTVTSSISPLKLTTSSFILAWQSSSGSERLMHFTANGATCSDVSWGTGWGSGLRNVAFVTVGDSVYMASGGDGDTVVLWKLIATTPSTTNIVDYEDWTQVTTIAVDAGSSDEELNLTLTADSLILQHSTATTRISGAGTSVTGSLLPVKRITIQDSLGMDAGSATVVIDNTGGTWSPESDTSEHPNILLPNAVITIELGYGTNIVQRFKGYIDRVSPGAHPAELTIVARDVLKLAVDQTAVNDAGSPVETYAAQSVYSWITAFATRCGLTYDCEACAIEIDEKTINWESYADIFNFCCDIAGFDYRADAQGTVHFRYATDRQPEAADEAVVLNGTTDVNMVNYPVVTGSVQVWSAAG